MGLLEKASGFTDRKTDENDDFSIESKNNHTDSLTGENNERNDGEEEKKNEGLLSKAESMIASKKTGGGLLEKAEMIVEEKPEEGEGSMAPPAGKETAEAEEIEERVAGGGGLLEKAETLVAGEVETSEVEVEKVELAQESMGDEIFSEEIFSGADLIEKEIESIQEKEPSSEEIPEAAESMILEKAAVGEEVLEKETIKETERERQVLKESKREKRPSVKAKKKKTSPSAFKREKKAKKEEEKDYVSLLKKSLMSDNVVEADNLAEEIILEKGFEEFSRVILNILMMATGGEFSAIYTVKNGFFKRYLLFPDKVNKKLKILNIKLKKSEDTLTALAGSKGPLFSKDKKAQSLFLLLRGEEDVRPWLFIPLIVSGVHYGFILVCRIDENRRPSKKLLKFISILYGTKLSLDILQSRLVEVEELQARLSDITELINSMGKTSVLETGRVEKEFQRLCSSLSVEMASLVLIKDEISRVIAIYGTSEETRVGYSVRKVGSKLRTVLKDKRPKILDGVPPSSFGMVGEDAKKANTTLIVPVVFGNESWGAIVIHRLKEKIKKIPKGLSDKLAYISYILSPVLIYRLLQVRDVIDTIYPRLSGELKAASRSKKKLFFLVVEIKNAEKVIDKVGFNRYLTYYNRIRDEVQKYANTGVNFWYPSPFSIVAMFRQNATEPESLKAWVTDVIGDVKNGVKSLNEIETEVKIYSYPDNLKGMKDIRAIF